MAGRFARYFLTFLVAASALLSACGGDEKGSLFDGLTGTRKTFWAQNVDDDTYYQVQATRVAEGTHCYIYLQDGLEAGQATIENLLYEFDNRIYPTDTTWFGSEPNPGADGDPKIYILLLDIHQIGTAETGFVSGYFSNINEYSRAVSSDGFVRPYSNQKEMFYVDIVRQTADDPFVLRTLAHEFQHMIHWEQKFHQRGVVDDLWVNEAMSEGASSLCYGPDPGRIELFQNTQAYSNPLSSFDSSLADYSKVALWSQYVLDQCPDNVFRLALQSTDTGAASVNTALAGTGKSFATLFEDWTMANLVSANPLLGDIAASNGHPEWRYNAVSMPRVVTSLTDNASFGTSSEEVGPLRQFSSAYRLYRPSNGPDGGINWTQSVGLTAAFLFDLGNGTVEQLASGVSKSYSSSAYVVFRNSTLSDAGLPDNVVFSSLAGPARVRAQGVVSASPAPRARATTGGRAICGAGHATYSDSWLRANGFRLDF
jgi:hypothetical protein